MSFWTIEEVADALGMTVAQVYETRRRKEYPGNLGRLRGRRLLFPVDLVQAGPQVPETTENPLEAILWTLQGIESKVAQIAVHLAAETARVNKISLPEAAALLQSYYFGDADGGATYGMTATTTTEEEE